MKTSKKCEAGSAMLMAVVVTLVVVGTTGAYYTISVAQHRQTTNATFGLQALYTAEAGTAQCVQDLNRGGTGILSGNFSNGSFTIEKTEYGRDGVDNDHNGDVDDAYEDNFMELKVEGLHSLQTRRLDVILAKASGGIYWNAVFAGNSSGDPNYDLEFGGRGANSRGEADIINGDVYSAGHVSNTGDAQLNPYQGQPADSHQVMYGEGYTDSSSQNPKANYTQGFQSTPDLHAPNYEVNADVNVTEALNDRGTTGFDDAGGTAEQQILDSDDPAHIFRMNPSDRRTLTDATQKNDYFLEDPTAPVRVDPNQNGSDAYQLRLSTGTGNNVVYYIDGNLHLNNRNTYSFKFYHPEATGIKITIVVKGNIYFGDNMFYLNKNKDAVAFIAMKDSNVADSGNVYFGDPIFGTTKRFEGYMYAENNFYDNNLGTPDSMTTTIYGNMTAGNQVQIQRDKANGHHVRLQVDFDDKIRQGKGPPGLPTTSAGGGGLWYVASWKQVP